MENFPFTIPYTVRVVDVNYGGHVANSAVLNFFQDARLAYLKHLGGYSEMNVGGGCGIILPEAHVKYLAEMFMGDELVIGVKIVEVGRTSFRMAYRIERDGKAAAEGETTLVCFDYAARKPRRLDGEFVRRVEEFEKSRDQ
ncbi:MAG: acyl-CoA thioesterase [Desulfuromonadales bacterium]|nr:acyl-CoA thioesterase [Desulfuromonadales bacterium]